MIDKFMKSLSGSKDTVQGKIQVESFDPYLEKKKILKLNQEFRMFHSTHDSVIASGATNIRYSCRLEYSPTIMQT
jgi:hypothetical protein